MTFTTLTFLLFLPVVWSLYWIRQTRLWQNTVLLVASYVFYGWWDYRFCALMAISSLVDYVAGIALYHTHQTRWRRVWLLCSLLCNLGMLGFFKYFHFFEANLIAAAQTVGWRIDPTTIRVILPVGISFYTFQTMSYTIDIFRRKISPTYNPVYYFTYVAFFPQLVAGPIERAGALLPQILTARRFDYTQSVDGCRQILWGFFKKMLLADNLAPLVGRYYDYPQGATGPELAFATVCFAFQIYCDFSAYSDIAIGLGKLFGINICRNFAYPYFSQSLPEFWRRWHISLSTWFRDYVYIPLGGNRTGPLRHTINLLLTFLISGFWHGALWNFIIWGAIHGAAMIPSVLRSRRPSTPPGTPSPAKSVLRASTTFAIVCLGWVFFRARTLPESVLILKKFWVDAVSLPAYASLATGIAGSINARQTLPILAVFIVVEWLQRRQQHPLILDGWPRALRWLVYSLLVWITLSYGTRTTGMFIYFQF